MIFITDELYAQLACRLFEALESGGGYFNGTVEYDTEAFYSTLTCSAIIYRTDGFAAGQDRGGIEKVVPVWWEFSTCVDGAVAANDFSWNEFAAFFPCHE